MNGLSPAMLACMIDVGVSRVEQTRDLEDTETVLDAIEQSLANLCEQLERVRSTLELVG